MSVWRGKEEEKRDWVQVSANTVDGEGEERSEEGEGVKLKSPTRMGISGRVATKGERTEVRKEALSEGPVAGR